LFNLILVSLNATAYTIKI